jgi:thiosulfate/3-mercaptopyruvate sulfurtransferase
MSQTVSPLVSPQWVAQQLGSPDLAILDASWHLPAAGRDPRAEFSQGHIPGAVFFDIDAISDPSSGLPHMLPDAPSFAKAMGALGVSDNMTIVVYDSLGVFSAPRAWWSLQTFGARKLYVLDGGLPAWRAAGLPMESGEAEPKPAIFNAQINSGAVASIADVAAALKNHTAQVADARSAERFSGAAPEPRPGLPSGHMPGARNLPIGKLIANGRMKAPAELLAAFHEAGLDPDAPIITSCGSGVTAAVINFALACAGKPAPRLYDGSWTQWALTPNAPIEPAP